MTTLTEIAAPVEADASAGLSVPAALARGGSALLYPGALAKFYAALQAREDEPGNGTVRVLQFGDSHTAADMFTGELRTRMQAQFGDGGVGFSYAGHPFAGYRILGSQRSESGGWTTLGTHFTQLGDGLLGLGGVALEGSRAGETVSLDAPCTTLELQYLRRSGGGTVRFAEDGVSVGAVSTDATKAEPANAEGAGTDNAVSGLEATAGAGPGGSFSHDCPAGLHHFTWTTEGDGPVRLLGTVALQPGVTWEAMGINGAEAPLMLKWNQPLFAEYLTAASPQLIVLAYGTNEAAARWDASEYRAVFTRLIEMLHRHAPDASVLVLGPGDRSLASTTYASVGRRHRRVAHKSWVPYSGTDRILDVQREVCRTHGCAFWDWRARQGGLGAMNRWVYAGYAQPDHTHLTGVGYRSLADGLLADLLSGYDAYKGAASSDTGAAATP